MIKLPRLTPLVQLVDPKTGLSTRQGADFWNQFATRIEAALSGVQQGTITASDTLHIGANLTLSADGTLSASAGGTSVDIANADSVVVPAATLLEFLGDVTLTAQPGSEADAYFPPLQVDGFDTFGNAVTFATVHDISMEGNAYLSTSGTVTELGIATENTTFSALAMAGSALLYFQFDNQSWTPPIPLTNIGSLNGAYSYFGTFSASEAVLIDPSVENDAIAAILTDPAILIGNFSGPLNSGTATSTISLPVTPGRLYVAIADHDVTVPVTSQTSIPFDTSIVSTMSSSTAPHPTGVLLGTDILAPETVNITVSSSGGFSTKASYLALLVGPPIDQQSDHVTITVPPLTVWNKGTEVSTNLHSIVAGQGVTITGDAHDATVTSFINVAGQTVEETLALGQGLSISGTSPGGLTLSNSGVVALVQGASSSVGSISVGSNLTLSGSVISASAPGTTLTAGGSAISSATIGAGLTIAGGTLSATGSGSETIAQNGTILTTAATEINFSGTTYGVSGGTVTVPDPTSIAASGVVGVWNGGTLYPTLVAGPNITLSGAGGTLTASASGGGGGGGATIVQTATLSAPNSISSFTANLTFASNTSTANNILYVIGSGQGISVPGSFYSNTSNVEALTMAVSRGSGTTITSLGFNASGDGTANILALEVAGISPPTTAISFGYGASGATQTVASQAWLGTNILVAHTDTGNLSGTASFTGGTGTFIGALSPTASNRSTAFGITQNNAQMNVTWSSSIDTGHEYVASIYMK